jgi:hypothetical protein
VVHNDRQTELTRELLGKLHPYVKGELVEALSSIKFIANMVSPDRKRAHQLERDKKGRIKVDIENPHILEDMDYFRPAALYFQEHKTYTHHYPSRHPNSEYQKFWKEERRRCIQGYTRESDGEWIPGTYYFYLNYSPIMTVVKLNQDDEDETDEFEIDFNFEDAEEAERVENFADVWDMDYLYFHYVEQAKRKGKYGTVLKTRGRGYSFKGGAVGAWVYHFFPKAKSYGIASESEYLVKDGLMNKTWDTIDWVDKHTPWKKRRVKDTETHKISGYKDLDSGTDKGFLSQVIAVTLKNAPEKARGKRGKAVLWEEAGKFPGLIKSWGIARPSMEQGRAVFGFMVAFGTGGTEGADFQGMEDLFYKCKAYRVNYMNNVFDKVKGKGTCAFYVGEYTNREGCYDNNGNSNVTKALIEIFYQRLEVIESSTDPSVITQEKADRSITPQEAVMRTEGTLFPVSDLKDYLSEIEPRRESFVSTHSTGRIGLKGDGSVELVPDSSIHPLRDFPISAKDDKRGGVEIFFPPVKDREGRIPTYRYIAGIDPVDDDYSSTDSLPSIFIFDTITDNIVAEFTGRPDTANEFYEVALRLLKMYNATANYENDKKGLFTYFYNQNALHYLSDTPSHLREMDLVKDTNAYGNKAKGTNSSKRINQYGRRLQRDWMVSRFQAMRVDENGDQEIIETAKFRSIRSIAYIKELIAWNEDGNFDRVSAMGMCMILREEVRKYSDRLKQGEDDSDDLANDEFFIANYYGVNVPKNYNRIMKLKQISHNHLDKIRDKDFDTE